MGRKLEMSGERDMQGLSRDDLVQEVLRLRTIVEQLRQENEALRRSSHRQAAPFSKGTKQEHPGTPGRKKGKGRFTYRQAPTEEQFSQPALEVPVLEPACPVCGGALVPAGEELVTITDVPVMPRPSVQAFRVARSRCQGCGLRVRGKHPQLPVSQQGATAHRLGVRLRATAHLLHHQVGIPWRRVSSVLKLLSGVSVTQSALTQDALRQSEGPVGERYQALRDSVQEAEVVYTDDTGWKVGGEPAFLMAFDTDTATVYQVSTQHRNEEVRELVPADYGGTLVCDRGKSYDARALERVRQSKCLCHLVRSVETVLEGQQGEARIFGQTLKALFLRALAVWKAYQAGRLDTGTFQLQGRALLAATTAYLQDRRLGNPDNQKLLDGIGRQDDRDHLLGFLRDPKVQPTNNRAERALRPAVIARKVSHCSKSRRGAEAYAAFQSVIQSQAKVLGSDLVESLTQLLLPPSPCGASP